MAQWSLNTYLQKVYCIEYDKIAENMFMLFRISSDPNGKETWLQMCTD